MTNTRKFAAAALTVAVIATSGVFAVPASAAVIRSAPVETAKATQVGYYGYYNDHYGYGYNYYPRYRYRHYNYGY